MDSIELKEKHNGSELEPPPRLAAGVIKPQWRSPYDPSITFEEYHYYATRAREEEKEYAAPHTPWMQLLLNKKENTADNGPTVEQLEDHIRNTDRYQISDEEWTNASRMFRAASWGAGFYLITTDVLGPYTVGYAMGTLGWAPGTVLYTVFAALTAYSGYLVWRVFVGVDSYEFPARNYGDLAFRIWGRVGRHITNIIQSISLILLAGQVTLQAGQNLSQTSRFRLCYVVCPIIYIVVGFTLSQIRTLKNYGLVANMSVYLNLLAIFITMGFVSHSPPNYQIATLGSSGSTADPTTITPVNGKYPAVMHYNGLPPNGLVGSLNGLMNCVLGYAGVQLYVEFMAEMRRPMDFIKAVWSATAFVYTVYLVYGCFVYYYQGQYTFNPSYMGVSVYGWQTAANMITLVALFISGGLYSNIGIKVVYNNVCVDILRAPPLSSWLGKRLYAGLVGLWWIVAFIIACAIPDFEGIVSIFSAATLVNLTYSVPAIIALGYDIQRNALRPERGEGFDPTTGQVVHDGSLLARWARGFVSGGPVQVCLNLWHSVYFLGALSLCGLGMYASIEQMIDAFKNPQLNSFSCRSPLDLSAT